jgi:hypothetical protein
MKTQIIKLLISIPVSLLTLALACTGSGCRSGSTTGGNLPNYEGTYQLATIDGKALPCRPAHEGGAPIVNAGSITLKADGTFTSTMSYGQPGGQTGSRDFSGTYTREGSRFTLKWTGAGITTADLKDATFTMNNEGMLLAYHKQPN